MNTASRPIHISKAQHGGAYIMVITAIMLIFMLVAVALSVTAASRRITARYAYNVGLFDLAVSGNEQALFLLCQSFDSQKEDVISRAWAQIVYGVPVVFIFSDEGLRLSALDEERFKQIFVEEAMAGYGDVLGDIFSIFSQAPRRRYQLTWELNTTFDMEEYTIINSYRAVATLTPYSGHFTISTRIHKSINGVLSPSRAAVQASIIWTASNHREITLDAYTISVLVANGAIFPDTPFPGMRIILDEFALTMVESQRIDIS